MFQKVKDLETGEEWKPQQPTDISRKRAAQGGTETEPPKVFKYS